MAGAIGRSRGTTMRWIPQNPKLARMLGQALFSIGGFVVVCGFIGRAAMTALNHARALGKMPPYNGLAEAYPIYPLWWVPEHIGGYVTPALVAAFGVYVALTAKMARNAR
jgi:hypothetical protein